MESGEQGGLFLFEKVLMVCRQGGVCVRACVGKVGKLLLGFCVYSKKSRGRPAAVGQEAEGGKASAHEGRQVISLSLPRGSDGAWQLWLDVPFAFRKARNCGGMSF